MVRLRACMPFCISLAGKQVLRSRRTHLPIVMSCYNRRPLSNNGKPSRLRCAAAGGQPRNAIHASASPTTCHGRRLPMAISPPSGLISGGSSIL